IHQMVRYAGAREENSWYGLGQTFTVAKGREAAPPPVDTPAGARLSENRLTPDGDLLVTAREPGFYRWRYNDHGGFAAVNVDGAEGDFTKLNFQEFVAGVTGGAGSAEGGAANNNFSNREGWGRPDAWGGV